jgi:hypothetical protein
MNLITVGVLCTDLIALPTVASDATLTLVIRTASGGTLAGGTFVYSAGIQWKLTFTPTVTGEIYAVEVTDEADEIVYSNSYRAIGQTITAPDSTSLSVKLQIINLALGKLMLSSISDLTDDTVPGLKAIEFWSACLKECLAVRPWSFATVIAALTEDEDVTPLYYSYAYTYPALAIKIWRIYDEATVDKKIGEKFRTLLIPGDTNKVVIETDLPDAYAEYSYFVDDAALFDAAFSDVLATRLAAELAMPLTGDQGLATKLISIFNTIKSEAERLNSYETYEPRQNDNDSSILNARG